MPEPSGSALAAPRIVVAFDFGLRRIGVASGNTLTRSATPLSVILASGGSPRWEDLDKLLAELKPALAVVGLPYNADGSESSTATAARRFAAELARRYGLEIALVDERYSSREAEARLKTARQSGRMRRRVAKADVDAAAACVILDRWLGDEK
ncbi:MAG TPA: Holliday junction resolvase RuvX [Steroidobacteraceae bacterium]|jgi:putative Holliday junction resolvase|nr:Holliday junction resolvase RuvX [Steroidobacteraceae bacterium]